jgi:hypothetical protein
MSLACHGIRCEQAVPQRIRFPIGSVEAVWQTCSLHGGRSSVGRAPVCGTGCRGFESRRSPQASGPYVVERQCSSIHCRSATAPLAQWQSNGLLIRRFWVRVPGGARTNAQPRERVIRDRTDPRRASPLWQRLIRARQNPAADAGFHLNLEPIGGHQRGCASKIRDVAGRDGQRAVNTSTISCAVDRPRFCQNTGVVLARIGGATERSGIDDLLSKSSVYFVRG